jgi:hypothetical protein
LPPQLKAFENGISDEIGVGESQIEMPFYLRISFLYINKEGIIFLSFIARFEIPKTGDREFKLI